MISTLFNICELGRKGIISLSHPAFYAFFTKVNLLLLSWACSSFNLQLSHAHGALPILFYYNFLQYIMTKSEVDGISTEPGICIKCSY